MEIQGSESKALWGMQQFLRHHTPPMVVDYSTKHIRALGSSIFEIFAAIDKFKYKPYLLRGEPNTPPHEVLRELSIYDLMQLTQDLDKVQFDLGVDLLLLPA